MQLLYIPNSCHNSASDSEHWGHNLLVSVDRVVCFMFWRKLLWMCCATYRKAIEIETLLVHKCDGDGFQTQCNIDSGMLLNATDATVMPVRYRCYRL